MWIVTVGGLQSSVLSNVAFAENIGSAEDDIAGILLRIASQYIDDEYTRYIVRMYQSVLYDGVWILILVWIRFMLRLTVSDIRFRALSAKAFMNSEMFFTGYVVRIIRPVNETET
eukprot:302477_1